MARLLSTIAGCSLASLALSSPLNLQLYPRQNASTPCAQVSASVATQTNAVPTVPAKLAYECITSVPFNQSAALALVDSIVPYLRWQSTTEWLKDPPREYREKIQPAYDIWGELEVVKQKVLNGEYANEFEFGFELYRLHQRTHDGHFVYIPDVVGTVFNWARPVPLVSVSADGKELPKIYVYADVLAESFGNASFTSSPVTEINGEDAVGFLENWGEYGSLQDRDALYNNNFYELATVSLGPVGSGVGSFAGSGRGRWIYPGPTTELVFENGTSKTYTNYASVLIPFDGITDGESLYKLWFTGSQPTETEEPTPSNSTIPTPTATTTSASATATLPAPGYPPPVVREAHNLIGGYYLEDEYSDVAVLSVPSFVGIDATVEFQAAAVKFLAAAKAAGKKKLVVDLSANGGGTILLGYDLYKLLFPSKVGHAASDRFRAFESTNLLGETLSEMSGEFPRVFVTEKQNETLNEIESDVVSSVFNYRTDTKVDDTPFHSWAEKFGPIEQKGANFSNHFRWNLSDVLTPFNSGNVYIHGYGPLANYTKQPFADEDVVVVTDGYCASTCTIFSELMRQRAGVKYVSLGGRPQKGITQAVGGVKGTNDLPWSAIQYYAQFAVQNFTTPEEAARLNKTQLNEYWNDVPFIRSSIGTAMSINFRDGIRDHDLKHASDIPLQFVYEAADCRILYTKEMTVDVTAIWKAVADSAWYGESHCVAGRLGGHGKKMAKRELSDQDKVLSRRMYQWRRDLRAHDYPLDVRTDLRNVKLLGDGMMWP